MVEGEFRKDAENFRAWGTLLSCTKPNGKHHPVAISTTGRHLVSCCLMNLELPATRDYFSPHQIFNGVPSGTEVAIHAFRKTLAKFHRDPGRVDIIFDARNAFKEVDHQRILDEVTVHAPVITRYVHIVYGRVPWIVAGRRMIQSLQGIQRGDPIGMFLFFLVLYPLIYELQETRGLDLNVWCA